jgi:uncharacterized cofD-like protein
METNVGARIVVIGGGTGSFMVLSALKDYTDDITALVSMADDGGSTGQLRDELGVLPPGDARQCLVALSKSPKVRDLFTYRFEEGSLKGHSFGNLFITALEKMSGNFADAIDTAGEVLDIDGRVVPITLDSVTLCVNDGKKDICHERNIREAIFAKLRPRLWMRPDPKANPTAIKAIKEADLVVIAPGGLYESLGSTLSVRGVGKALAGSKAKKVYVCNLMNQTGHTDDFSVNDYAEELERLAGAEFLDYVIFNKNRPSDELLKLYAKKGETPVRVDEAEFKTAHYKAKGSDLLSNKIWKNSSGSDALAHQRALIRHDSNKVARRIMKVYFS